MKHNNLKKVYEYKDFPLSIIFCYSPELFWFDDKGVYVDKSVTVI